MTLTLKKKVFLRFCQFLKSFDTIRKRRRICGFLHNYQRKSQATLFPAKGEEKNMLTTSISRQAWQTIELNNKNDMVLRLTGKANLSVIMFQDFVSATTPSWANNKNLITRFKTVSDSGTSFRKHPSPSEQTFGIFRIRIGLPNKSSETFVLASAFRTDFRKIPNPCRHYELVFGSFSHKCIAFRDTS